MSYGQSTTFGYGRAKTAVVPLADAANIAVDAALGDYFSVTLSVAGRIFDFPTNLETADRRVLIFEVVHGGDAYVITAAGYEWGDNGPPGAAPAGTRDYLTFVWNGATLGGTFVAGYA